MSRGDYISQSVAVALAMEYCPDDDGVCSKSGHDLRELLDDLENAPPADVRPVVRGHWVWNPNGMDWGLGAWCCDQCRIKAETWWANDRKNNPLRCSGGRFCGNCGADMRPAPEPPAETPAQICQTCGTFETCPWKNDPNIAEYRQTAEGRVVGCSDYKDTN
jgi:hypothetical protein